MNTAAAPANFYPKIFGFKPRTTQSILSLREDGVHLGRPPTEKYVAFIYMFDTFSIMKLPQNKSLSGFARSLRNNGTKAEAVLWKYIKNKNGYGFQFHRQKVIGNYIADFYCPALGLVIEVDGNSHDTKYEHDKQRDEYMESLGLCVLRIDNYDVLFRTRDALFFVDTFIVHRINELDKRRTAPSPSL